MVQMSGSGAGYLHETITTPNMHALVFHVPTMIKMHGSLKQFSGQGIDSVTITSDIGYDCSKTSRNLQKTTVYNHKFVLTRCWKKKWWLPPLLSPKDKQVGCLYKPSPCREICQESLQDYERQPRKYLKKDQAFWRSGGKQEVAKKYPQISLSEIPTPQAPVTLSLSQQSPKVLEQSEKDLKRLKITKLV